MHEGRMAAATTDGGGPGSPPAAALSEASSVTLAPATSAPVPVSTSVSAPAPVLETGPPQPQQVQTETATHHPPTLASQGSAAVPAATVEATVTHRSSSRRRRRRRRERRRGYATDERKRSVSLKRKDIKARRVAMCLRKGNTWLHRGRQTERRREREKERKRERERSFTKVSSLWLDPLRVSSSLDRCAPRREREREIGGGQEARRTGGQGRRIAPENRQRRAVSSSDPAAM
ncbi:splicing regulatory glutamine/lysine-rich protein 1-like isoform X1 [Neodiprion virginianus]|uniref:splicing regulatory glutamine/lysine-rich protein 1-like isoform X1 n=2 Tax=Neodiprion TaxID=270857 RepID=UPI001EE729F4|nr:splicing regulatory glutamine/lysine-rich protein 1-like isoform X1 [Neodiprion virginianus]